MTWPTLCGLALGVAIVLWGAGYKMAQYPQRGCAFRVMAPAKLLTENKQANQLARLRTVLTAAAQQRPTLRYFSAWIGCLLHFVPQTQGALDPSRRRSQISPPEFIHFSFRPPPRSDSWPICCVPENTHVNQGERSVFIPLSDPPHC